MQLCTQGCIIYIIINIYFIIKVIYILLLNIGQWRRKWKVYSVFEPQLQSGFKHFLKLYLKLCSRKWLSSRRSSVKSSGRKYLHIRIFLKIKQDWPLYNGPFHSGYWEKRTFWMIGRNIIWSFMWIRGDTHRTSTLRGVGRREWG